MNFQAELTEFPSMVHRAIYSAARGITPLEYSMASMTDENLRASYRSLYDFVLDMLSDMYDNPEAYALPVMVLENFLNGKKINGMKQKFPSKTKDLLAQTRNATSRYSMLLWMLGNLGEFKGNTLTLTPDNMKAIDKMVYSSVSPISLNKRLEALERVGLQATDKGFVSKKHKNIFPALVALASKAGKPSGFDFFAFNALEFRNIATQYKPTPEDYFRPLFCEQRKYANILHEFAMENKCRPVVSTFCKVEHKYKGTQVMCIGSEGDHERLLDVRITGAYHWENHGLINDRLTTLSPEFQKQAMRHIWRCDGCSTSHLGRFVEVLGKQQRVCGGGLIGFRWRNPTEHDMEIMRQLIRFRCEIIEENNKK